MTNDEMKAYDAAMKRGDYFGAADIVLSAGEPQGENRLIVDGKPVFGLFTFDEMKAAYGDNWREIFGYIH